MSYCKVKVEVMLDQEKKDFVGYLGTKGTVWEVACHREVWNRLKLGQLLLCNFVKLPSGCWVKEGVLTGNIL
jgi:hypothetical protein